MWHGIGQQQSALKGAMRAEAADPTETLLYSTDKPCQCWQIVVTYLPMCMTGCSRSYFMVLETDEIIVSSPLI